MAIKPALNQFNGGEIQPQLEGRFDWQKFNYSAKLCKNFIPTVEGYLKRRGGTHFVAKKRGVGDATFRFVVIIDYDGELPDDEIPSNVSITYKGQGYSIPLTNTGGEYFHTNIWRSDYYTFKESEDIRWIAYIIDNIQFTRREGRFIVKENQEDFVIHLAIINTVSNMITVNIIAPEEVTVVTYYSQYTYGKTFEAREGYSFDCKLTYLGQDYYIDNLRVYDKGTLYVYVDQSDNRPRIGTGVLFKRTVPGESSYRLPACKLRIAAVGGGGGALQTSTRYISGGGAAGFDVEMSIPEGIYTFECGGAGLNGVYPDTKATAGVATTIKKGSTIYASAGGGGGARSAKGYFHGGDGGVVSFKDGVVTKTYWTQKGNPCTYSSKRHSGSLIRGASIYDGCGAGAGYTTNQDDSYADGSNGYIVVEFAEE